MRTTLATTRFQLKRVLAKTATRRQSELMRLMLSLPGQ
jgi:DNA-binding CsgD family transcriptional regulator